MNGRVSFSVRCALFSTFDDGTTPPDPLLRYSWSVFSAAGTPWTDAATVASPHDENDDHSDAEPGEDDWVF